MSGNKRKVTTEECYCIMLEEANVAYDYLLALPEAEPMLKKTFRVVRKIDEREVNGKTLNISILHRLVEVQYARNDGTHRGDAR